MTASSVLVMLASFTLPALALWGIRLSRARFRQALRRSFERQRFPTPTGTVNGSQLHVVQTRTPVSRSPGNTPAEVFWYCVGPGPSYILAIAQVRRQGRHIEADWNVRPLTEERLRAALAGDRKALARAFG